ncbi:MAG TPA: hypothetical protein VGJ15_00075, partial [Pirellulales bacterium]
MSEQNQSGSSHLQSSAIVAAAVITTLGAITAACIQTGWLKPTGDLPLPAASTAANADPLLASSSTPYPTNSLYAADSIGQWNAGPIRTAPAMTAPSAAMPSIPAPSIVSPKRPVLATFTGTIEPVNPGPSSTTLKAREPVAQTPQHSLPLPQQGPYETSQQKPPELFWGAGEQPSPSTSPGKTLAPTARPINALPVSAMMPIDPPTTFSQANLVQPTTIPSLLDTSTPQPNQAVALPASAVPSTKSSTPSVSQSPTNSAVQ